MKRILFSILCTIAACTVQAQSYEVITFESTTGSEVMKAVGTVITFVDGNLVAKNDAKEIVLPLARLKKFYFAGDPASVDALSAETEVADVVIYTLSGMRLGHYKNIAAAEALLPKGIYVMKSNSTSKKIIVK